MGYLRILFQSVGGRWFLLPGFVSGTAGLIVLLKGLGMIWLPDISYWALAFFVVLPISIWSIPALVRKVSHLQEQIEPSVAIRFEPRDPWVRETPARTWSRDDPKREVRDERLVSHYRIDDCLELVRVRKGRNR